jgi:hypothetical protein
MGKAVPAKAVKVEFNRDEGDKWDIINPWKSREKPGEKPVSEHFVNIA